MTGLQDPALDPDGVCPECSGLRKPCTACNSTGLLSVAYSMAKGQIRQWREWGAKVPHAEMCKSKKWVWPEQPQFANPVCRSNVCGRCERCLWRATCNFGDTDPAKRLTHPECDCHLARRPK